MHSYRSRTNASPNLKRGFYERKTNSHIQLDGEIENWNERFIIPPMIQVIQEQQKEIEQLKTEIKELKQPKN